MRLRDVGKLKRRLFLNEKGERIPFRDCDNFPVEISMEQLRGIIKTQPIVYDMDKVVEQLNCIFRVVETNEDLEWNRAINSALKSVKDGGNVWH